MPRTVRILRIALPIAFVIFIAVLFISYTSSARRAAEDQTPVPEPVAKPEEGHPQLITHQFEDTHSEGGRTLSKITANKTVGFSSGWHTLEDVEVTIYRTDGGSYVVSAPSARFKSDTKRAEVRGGVRVTSGDGLDITTREIDFDGRRLTNGIPVKFKVDRWSGEALGVDLDVDTQTMKLLDRVRAVMEPPDQWTPPMRFAADSARFDRTTGEALFEGHVEIHRGVDRFDADRMVARFDQSRSVLLGIEGSGNVLVNLGAQENRAIVAARGDEKEIRADHLSVETGPNGEVRAATLAGEGRLARATLLGTPQRVIEAERFRVSLEQKTIRDIEASGQAVMTESSGDERRTARAGLFRIYLDANTGEMTSAYLERNVTFDAENLTAASERANYSVRDDRLVLTAESGSTPTIDTDGARLRAEVIEAAPARGLLRARGRVVTRLEDSDGKGESTMFPGEGGQVFVNADTALINQAEESAIFSGHVKAWQGNNNLFADELQVADRGASLQARGNVRTTLYNTTGKESGPISTVSERLSAKRSDGSITLHGHVLVTDGGRSIRCDESRFLFDSQRQLDRVVSTGSIELSEKATGRKGTGSKVVYEVAQRQIVIDGDPASMTDPQGTIKGSRIVFDVVKNRVDVVRGDNPTEATIQPHGGGFH